MLRSRAAVVPGRAWPTGATGEWSRRSSPPGTRTARYGPDAGRLTAYSTPSTLAPAAMLPAADRHLLSFDCRRVARVPRVPGARRGFCLDTLAGAPRPG